jgi:glycosyltransferase involved in cell wall biosynthesis
MTIPEVSVIVPVHNQAKFIGRCLRSALKQTLSCDRYEIIVINDGSTDHTATILDQFSSFPPIRVIHNTERTGLPAALNAGIKTARGQFIIRLDSDDYVHSEYLNVLQLFLSMNPDFDAVACDYLLVDENEQVLGRKSCQDHPIGCGIMFRVEQLIDLGLYDEQLRICEDADFRIRFNKRFRMHRIPLALYRYRRHLTNITNDVNSVDHYNSLLVAKHADGASR